MEIKEIVVQNMMGNWLNMLGKPATVKVKKKIVGESAKNTIDNENKHCIQHDYLSVDGVWCANLCTVYSDIY